MLIIRYTERRSTWAKAFCLGFTLWAFCVSPVVAQRTWKQHSVLATGNWYRVAVSTEGIYKMDGSFLSGLGLPSSIPSSQLRIYMSSPGMLPEPNSAPRIDDLEEMAIWINDGGDGTISGGDAAFFYAAGPHPWKTDTAARRFHHQKNLYSERSYYYISLGGTGKRINTQVSAPNPTIAVSTFDERYFHELDSVNFLSSGKEWYGEEFANLPGRPLSRNFSIPLPAPVPGTDLKLTTSLAARSIGNGSGFQISLNGNAIQQIAINPVTGLGTDIFAQTGGAPVTSPAPAGSLTLNIAFQPGSFNAQGWLNWFEIFYTRPLALATGQSLLFRHWGSLGNSGVGYSISGADAATQVWDISDPLNPVRMAGSLSGPVYNFSADAQLLRNFAAFGSSVPAPTPAGRVTNQDLHAGAETDYLLVTHPQFLQQAQRLAAFHNARNLRTTIVTVDQVYHEFSGGIPDPAAIRDLLKMYYDRYRSTWNSGGKYLLLFGRGSYDPKARVNNNTSFVPAWESTSSLDPLATHVSDDFFGFLDDNEDVNSALITNLLDIGIGRVPVKHIDEAKNFVDKVIAYHAPQAFGPWRTNANFVADDEDFNLHLQDAETIAATAAATAPFLNIYKIYLDAFRQEGGSAGGTYPDANTAVNNNILAGTLIWNYSGHGGAPRLAEEVVIDQQIVNSFNNPDKLPLFITATCDFAPFDQPGINSLGENLLVRPKTGAIALMTTTRIVFAFSNRILNNNYLQLALQRDSTGKYRSLGEAVQAAKNYTYQTNSDITNNRKFTLLGDPALTIAYPKDSVVVTKVNDRLLSSGADTLSATEFTTIEGEVTDRTGSRIADFNGVVHLTLFDKPQMVNTLVNDATSLPASFQVQTSSLFKGKVSAQNGKFRFQFRLPRDINYQFGPGKISLYAQNGRSDAAGFTGQVQIGGIQAGSTNDNEGPKIRAFLNDEKFVNGSVTNEMPVLLLRLTDSSGINTGTAGVDHDLVVTIDGDNQKYFVLNDFYETDLDSYQSGSVRFQLPRFTPGRHTLTIKAWDVLNNSNVQTLDFAVASDGSIVLDHVLNYPNPFTVKTAFWFEHNRPGTELRLSIEIFTVTGKLIKTIRRTIITEGTRSMDTEWDGRDDYGDLVGRGVYLYRLTVQTADGKKASQLQRIVSLR